MPGDLTNMNERAQILLKTLVERYIADGQPVGSRALSKYSGLDLSPASIRNVMAKTGRSESAARAEFEKSNPQGRIVQPQEVADAVLWLCGDGASAVTGQAISVSGGEVM